jgi:hypothetical protein
VVLDFAGDGFPFPLAITYDRLQTALDDQDPDAVAWRFRDAFECLIKLASSLAIADFHRDSPELKSSEGTAPGGNCVVAPFGIRASSGKSCDNPCPRLAIILDAGG